MVRSIFEGCDDSCGWVAAVVCVISFGSFGVPIKTNVKVEVHPLVMQSYKTIVCFCTSWLVIFMGEPVRWTNWGLLSGLFWVPGASCGIYAIRNAGLAVAVGTWSSIIVLTSFLFGFIVFQEQIRDFGETCMAFLLLLAGLGGMSRYSAPPPTSSSSSSAQQQSSLAIPASLPSRSSLEQQQRRSTATSTSGRPRVERDYSGSEHGGLSGTSSLVASSTAAASIQGPPKSMSHLAADGGHHHHTSASPMSMSHAIPTGLSALEIEPLIPDHEDDIMHARIDDDDHKGSSKDHMVFLGGRISLTRRQMGILGAVINGAWGGMNLVPLHYAQQEGLAGAGYLISYAGGALVVNTILWIIYFGYYLHQNRGNVDAAMDCLPNWHLEELWFPGLMAGLLYSLGNFSAILAVSYLGQGTGFSFCQMQLFISGLWGVFYFREIKGTEQITKWFISAFVAVVGIIWLSYEHVGGSVGHR